MEINCYQRSRLCAGWEIEFRLPVTEVEFCNIVDVLFNCQIYNVLLELKQNSSTNVEAYSVCPTCTKPHVACSAYSVVCEPSFDLSNPSTILNKVSEKLKMSSNDVISVLTSFFCSSRVTNCFFVEVK